MVDALIRKKKPTDPSSCQKERPRSPYQRLPVEKGKKGIVQGAAWCVIPSLHTRDQKGTLSSRKMKLIKREEVWTCPGRKEHLQRELSLQKGDRTLTLTAQSVEEFNTTIERASEKNAKARERSPSPSPTGVRGKTNLSCASCSDVFVRAEVRHQKVPGRQTGD